MEHRLGYGANALLHLLELSRWVVAIVIRSVVSLALP